MNSAVYQNNKEIQEYVNKILDGLQSIPEAISMEISEYTLEELMKNAAENIKSYKDSRSGFVCEINVSYPDKILEVNLHHFWSIVTNLVGNSKEATYRQKNNMRKIGKGSQYQRFTSLKISSDENNLTIVVEDNGGGFPDVEKIYQEIVTSSKLNSRGEKRSGEGTIYIKMFTKMMKGEIEAENIMRDDTLGARTKIVFPLKSKEA